MGVVGGCAADRASALSAVGGVGGGGPDDAGAEAPLCAYGQIVCDGQDAKLCDGRGEFVQVERCTSECKDGLGCVTCVPNAGICSFGRAVVCDATGKRTETFACDGPGMSCDPDGCHGPCSPATMGRTNAGCEFWPTVTANSVWGAGNGVWDAGFHFGVLLGNVGSAAAKVTITSPTSDPPSRLQPDIAPGEVRTVPLAWVMDLKGPSWAAPYRPTGPNESVKSASGSYRISSDQPLIAYQFNPLEASLAPSPACPSLTGATGRCYSYSSDATLLLPGHVLAKNYVVSGYHAPHLDPNPAASKVNIGDFLTITATQMSTVLVNLRPNQTLLQATDTHWVANQAIVLPLLAGQVIQLFTPGASADDTLSGAEVSAGAPLQLISGVGCASIPSDPASCGHIEDNVLPLESLGKEYIVPVLRDPSGAAIGNTIRVQSVSEGTAITFEPAMMTGVTLGRGEVVELTNVMVDMRISSSAPFAVTQYTKTRSKVADSLLSASGPTQITAAPTSAFATMHSFAASPHFDASFVAIIAPTGASVMLDRMPLSSDLFMAISSTGMSVARAAVTDNAHVHTVTADKPVGVIVYGFGPYASYAYSGAVDLARRAVGD